MHFDHHLFLSYARKDNDPEHSGRNGWVTAFARELRLRHQHYSGRELRIFFDTQAIEIGRDWKRELGAGLRASRLFLAFLSPNYLASPNCLWEWEEYLRREHSAARGDDGITPIFFVTPKDLTANDDQRLAAWLADLHRRNRDHNCELQPWFDRGPEVLRELDAAERSGEVRGAPRAPSDDLRPLGQRLDALDRRIAARLDHIALADLAPGNVVRSHEHFVGRHQELSALHTLMMTGGPQSGGRGMGGRGMIAATHSPGGLGKTALARQYAHAYAEFYAAGGTWEIGCEGQTSLGSALLKLADDPRLRTAGEGVLPPLVLSDAQRADPDLAAVAILDFLFRLTQARVSVLREELKRHPDRQSPEADLPVIERPRCLLILDNVDQPALLSAAQVALLPAVEWLEIIVTTRLDPARFGAGERWQQAVEIPPLPDADALDLVRDFQPGHRFASEAEETAAREIVRALGGYTLAVELVAAYLGDHAQEGYRPSAYLQRLRQEGLASVDDLASDPAVAKDIRHGPEAEKNRIATLIRWSLERLSPPARTALEFASLLQPDQIPLHWLEILTRGQHAEALTDQPGHPAKWAGVWRELHGLRLLHPAEQIEVDDRGVPQLPRLVRLHRLVAQHVGRANAQEARMLAELDEFFDRLTTAFEQQVGQGKDEDLRAQHPWLRDHLDHLIRREPTATLLRSAQVAADFEGEHGLLSRALDLTERVLKAKEKLLLANPESAQAARDVSVSLNKLADFLARRGLPGDAEQALAHYQRGLEVSERLLVANPESAQAARDVSVSLERLAQAVGAQGGPESARQALEFQSRALGIALKLREGNPRSLFHGRTAAVSYFLTFERARAAGQEELAVKCLAGCHAVLRELVTAGCQLDAQMMDLYRQLNATFGGEAGA